MTYAGLTTYAFAPSGRVSRREDRLRRPCNGTRSVPFVKQGLDLLFAPAPLELQIIEARLKVDRRVFIGMTLEPAVAVSHQPEDLRVKVMLVLTFWPAIALRW